MRKVGSVVGQVYPRARWPVLGFVAGDTRNQHQNLFKLRNNGLLERNRQEHQHPRRSGAESPPNISRVATSRCWLAWPARPLGGPPVACCLVDFRLLRPKKTKTAPAAANKHTLTSENPCCQARKLYRSSFWHPYMRAPENRHGNRRFCFSEGAGAAGSKSCWRWYMDYMSGCGVSRRRNRGIVSGRAPCVWKSKRRECAVVHWRVPDAFPPSLPVVEWSRLERGVCDIIVAGPARLAAASSTYIVLEVPNPHPHKGFSWGAHAKHGNVVYVCRGNAIKTPKWATIGHTITNQQGR